METDGKRLLVAVAIAMGLLLVWNILFPPEPPPKDETASVEKKDDATATDTPTDESGRAPSAEAEAVPRGEEQKVELEFADVKAVFSSYGGVLESFTLQRDRYREGKEQLDLVRADQVAGYPFELSFPGSTLSIPDGAEFTPEKISDTEVVFRWSSAELAVEKHYKLVPEDFLIVLEVTFKNLSSAKAEQRMALSTTSFQDPKADTGGGMGRVPQEWEAVCFVGGEIETRNQEDLRKKSGEWSGQVAWAGFTHSYFLAALAPKAVAEDARFTCRVEPAAGAPAGSMKTVLEYPTISLKPEDPAYTWTTTAYFGPKYLDKLDHIDKVVGYPTQFREAVDLGFFAIIARPMLSVMKWFYGFLGNWGLSIVFLTLLVKLLLLPWTHKSMKSMKKMSVLAPRMKEIQEKYADDKAAQQQRIMEMYKQEGVNPLSGCLPMLLQMPIWIALYRMLMYAAELYRAPLIPGWIDDLTAPDPYYILPILLVVVMFAQAKVTPAAGTGAQQKMLKYGMPLIFGGMSFVFPAGLTLYIFTNTVLTGVHHLFLRRGDEPASGGDGKAASKAVAGKAAIAAASGDDESTGEPESPAPKAPRSAKKRKKKGKRK